MSATRLLAGAVVCLAVQSAAFAQAPANDDCANATPAAVGVTFFDGTAATTDGLSLDPLVCDMGTFGDDQIYRDVWFTFTAPTSELYDIEIVNNGFPTHDSRLAVYDQSTCPDDPANVIACDEDAGLGLLSMVSDVSLTMGDTYFVRVGDYDGLVIVNPANLVITPQGPPPTPPANDDCANATVAALGLTPVDTTGATDGTGLPLDPLVCDMGTFGDDQIYADAWFTFTPAATDEYDIALVNNGNPAFDSRLAVYNQPGCPDDPANVIACDDDAGPILEAAVSVVTLTGGVPYLIRVGSYGPGTTEELSALSIGLTPPPPANDPCANAAVAVLGGNPLDTSFATLDGSALDPLVCDMDAGPDERLYNDVWFTFTAATTDNFTISTDNSSFDSRIAIYSTTTCPANPANVIACDDSGFDEEVMVNLTSGQAYLIRVGGATPTERGTSTLIIGVTPPAPANDDCANAAPAMVGLTPFDSTSATDGAGLALDPLVCDMGTFGDEQIYQDVWFSFTSPTTDFYDIASVNSGNPSFDSRIAVYNQSTCPDDPANVIGCDDDEGPGLEALAAGVSLTMGDTYLIRVGSFSATTTEQPAALSISVGLPPPSPPANDNCANAEVITAHGSYAFDLSLATTDGPDLAGFCDYGEGDDISEFDVWFEYTPSVGGCTYISTLNLAGLDTRIAVYDTTTCPVDPATILACSDEEVQPIAFPFEAGMDIDLNAGQTYLIQLGVFDTFSAIGPGTLLIGPGPVAVNSDGGMQTGAPGCAPGPVFASSCNGDGGNQMGCTPCPCGNEATPGTIGGCLNSSGGSTRIDATGDTSVSLPSGDTTDLRLTLTGAPASAFCVMLSGGAVAPQNMANPCFGLNSGAQAADRDGLRCAVGGGQAVLRHGGRSADAMGQVMDSSGPSRVWGGEAQPAAGLAGQAGFTAGQTRHFQVTHREDAVAVCMRGLNTSQALEVTFTP